MGGSKPYIQQVEYELAQIAYALRFWPEGLATCVAPARISYGDDGLPGSVLDVVLAHGIEIPAWNRNLARE
ncbi:hypothetical protein [Gloeobacter morelensis]|uniref:Uncharacterized protein n=1 Tax=Gloeobacter morelensis MG652769 TaxID=2781736 RepID=A0ABY3PI92_9CYAN|nr:hypothetical protein [Gloeobacter morelensis]UFP93334.1 hypothetical protein ISF26_16200 [Gloeobacter morelensis MG652769]